MLWAPSGRVLSYFQLDFVISSLGTVIFDEFRGIGIEYRTAQNISFKAYRFSSLGLEGFRGKSMSCSV